LVADDLAVAFSELVPSQTWLTRIAMRVPPNATGTVRDVTLAVGEQVEPVVTALELDTGGCVDGQGGAGGAGGSAPPPPSPTRVATVPAFQVDRSCGATQVGAALDAVDVVLEESQDEPDAIYVETDCSGDTVESYAVTYDEEALPESDGCSGDTSATYETWETVETTSYGPPETSNTPPETSDCGGDTSTTRTPSDSSGEDCGGDTTTTYETTTYDPSVETDSSSYSGDGDCGSDSSSPSRSSGCGSDTSSTSSSSDGCSGDSSNDSCSGDSADTVSSHRRPRRPRIRLSQAAMGVCFFLFPVRRFTRRRKRRRRRGSRVR
jgi:hypothetical protein